MENLPFGIFTYPSILLVCIICLLPLCPTKAIDCLDLINQYKIENAELADLQSLSRDVLSGERGQDLTATERLCLLHAIEEELMKDYDYEALISLGRQLEILADLEAPMEKVNEITNYEYLAKAYLELGVADSCVYYANRVEALLDPTVEEELVQLLRIRQSKLMGLIDLLQFNRAEEMIAESEDWIKATGKERGAWGLFYYDKAVLTYYFQKFESCLPIINQCLSYHEIEQDELSEDYINALSFKGKLLSIFGKLQKAEEILLKARRLSLKGHNPINKSQIIVNLNLSELYSYKGDKNKVSNYIGKAKELAKEYKGSPLLLPKIYLFDVANYLDLKDLNGALASSEKGMKILRQIDGALRQRNLFGTLSSATSVFCKDLFLENKDSSLLVKSFYSALDNLNYLKYFSVKSNNIGEKFGVSRIEEYEFETILESLSSIDESQLNASKMSYYFDVFDFEKAQQISFNYLIEDVQIDLENSRRSTHDISSYIEFELFEIRNEEKVDKHFSLLRNYSESKLKAKAIFEKISSAQIQTRYESFLKFSEGSNTTFVNYFIEDERLNMLYCFNGIMDLKIIQIEKDSLETLCRNYLTQLYEPNISEDSFKKYYSISNELYKLLIEPIGKIHTKDLVLIPHGILNKIPFESLCSSGFEFNNSEELPFLLRKFNMSYANSMQSFQYQEKKKNLNFDINLLALAPDFSKSEGLELVRSELSKLIHNIAEAKTAAKLTDGKYLDGSAANLNNLEYYGKSASVIHLATHSFMDSITQFPSIILSKSENSESDFVKHNLVNSFKNRINANLVVLSACETAIGPIEFGDGMMGIPQNIMRNGVSSVISSLWEINDKSTMDVMNQFYQNISVGNNIPLSLNESKRKYLMKNPGIRSHPFFWAGLISHGKTDSPIVIKSKYEVLKIFLPVILVLIIAVYLLWFKN